MSAFRLVCLMCNDVPLTPVFRTGTSVLRDVYSKHVWARRRSSKKRLDFLSSSIQRGELAHQNGRWAVHEVSKKPSLRSGQDRQKLEDWRAIVQKAKKLSNQQMEEAIHNGNRSVSDALGTSPYPVRVDP